MIEWLKPALEWLQTPAKYFLPLFVASSFGLFAPLDMLNFLGIESWCTEYKFYLGCVFVFSAAVVGCHFGAEIVRWLVKWYEILILRRKAEARLKVLTIEEQRVLAQYLKGNTRTQHFHIDDGIVRGLVESKILYAALREGDIYKFPINMQPWAWAYLKKHPNLVGVVVKTKGGQSENP